MLRQTTRRLILKSVDYPSSALDFSCAPGLRSRSAVKAEHRIDTTIALTTHAGSPKIRTELPLGQNQGIPKASKIKNTMGLSKFINTYILNVESRSRIFLIQTAVLRTFIALSRPSTVRGNILSVTSSFTIPIEGIFPQYCSG